jgi:hypothetical protein
LLDAVVRHDRLHGVQGDPLVGEGLLARELARVLGVFERLERVDRDSLALR